MPTHPFPKLHGACRSLFALIPGAGRPLIHELASTPLASRVFARGVDSHVVALTGGFPAEVFE